MTVNSFEEVNKLEPHLHMVKVNFSAANTCISLQNIKLTHLWGAVYDRGAEETTWFVMNWQKHTGRGERYRAHKPGSAAFHQLYQL